MKQIQLEETKMQKVDEILDDSSSDGDDFIIESYLKNQKQVNLKEPGVA